MGGAIILSNKRFVQSEKSPTDHNTSMEAVKYRLILVRNWEIKLSELFSFWNKNICPKQIQNVEREARIWVMSFLSAETN